MTLYVSQYNGYTHGVNAARAKTIETNEGFTTVRKEPELTAVFGPKTLPYAARMQALAHFDSRSPSHDGDPPGPIRQSHISQDEEFFEMVGQPAEPWMYFTAFDTETDIPESQHMEGDVCGWSREQVRARFEEVLDHPQMGSLGEAYIKIERVRLAAPWPNYDTVVTAQGWTKERVGAKLVELSEAFGVGPAYCIEYERENEDRDYVIAAFEAKLVALEQRAAEDEALSVG